MARVKRGTISRAKHKKTLGLAKGYRMSRSRRIKTAQEAVLHAGEYAFAGRRQKKRLMRETWIIRINAAVRKHGMTYSQFIAACKRKNIALDRKILSTLVTQPEVFSHVLESVQSKEA